MPDVGTEDKDTSELENSLVESDVVFVDSVEESVVAEVGLVAMDAVGKVDSFMAELLDVASEDVVKAIDEVYEEVLKVLDGVTEKVVTVLVLLGNEVLVFNVEVVGVAIEELDSVIVLNSIEFSKFVNSELNS